MLDKTLDLNMHARSDAPFFCVVQVFVLGAVRAGIYRTTVKSYLNAADAKSPLLGAQGEIRSHSRRLDQKASRALETYVRAVIGYSHKQA